MMAHIYSWTNSHGYSSFSPLYQYVNIYIIPPTVAGYCYKRNEATSEHLSGPASDMGTVLRSPYVAKSLPLWLVSLLYWSVWWLWNFCLGGTWAQQSGRRGSLEECVLCLQCIFRVWVSLHTFRWEGVDGYQLTQQPSPKVIGAAVELQD